MGHLCVEVRGQLRGVGSLLLSYEFQGPTHVVRFCSRHPHRLSYLIGFSLVVVMEVVMWVVMEVVMEVLDSGDSDGGGGGKFVCVFVL